MSFNKKQSTVQKEIEKELAIGLRQRFLDDINDETTCKAFDKQDIEKLKKRNIYFHLFIRARQGDLNKAYEMMIECLKWRKSYKINDMKIENLDEEVLKAGILHYHNLDKRNNPILIFHGNKYPYKDDRKKAEELEKVFAFLLELQERSLLGTKITVICDHHDASLANIDLDFFKFIINLFGMYYPDILESFIVLDVPWRLSAVWKVIKNWLSNDMFSRFKFLDKSKLTDYVDKSKIISSMDGEDMFQYTWPPLPDNTHDVGKLTRKDKAMSSSFEKGSSQEDLLSGFEDAIDYVNEPMDGSDNLLEEKRYLHSSTDKSMGGTLGTQIRNRFKDHFSEKDKTLGDEHEHIEEAALIVTPKEEIVFREVEHESEVQETLTIKNTVENTLIFKVKTNSPSNFRVRPHVGALLPGSSKEITLMLLLKGDSGQEKLHYAKDKFLILFSEITEPITNSTDISELWKDIPKMAINEHKLSCRVLDVNGFEKRPKTIEDVLEMSVKLKQQICELDAKLGKINNSFSQVMATLQQQTYILISGLIFLACLVLGLFWFR